MKAPTALLLATELYSSHGGVQAYMRRMAEILSTYNGPAGLDCISLLDSSAAPAQHRQAVTYRSFRGAAGNKLRFIAQAIAAAAAHRGQIVVAGHPGLGPVAYLLKRMGLARSYVVLLHGIEAWEQVPFSDRIAAAGADRIVATTAYTAGEFCRHNRIPPSRTAVLPLALPEAELEPLPPPARSDRLRMLTVGRLKLQDGYKGVDSILEAMALARTQGAKLELTVVGDGDELPRLKLMTADLDLRDSVIFTGAVPQRELDRQYRDCDVFVMPSRGEGFGIVFLEAMRHGKPCIGGNHGGTPEVIRDGEDGYLVEHGNVTALAERLLELAGNPALRARLGNAARTSVAERYLFPAMRQRWFTLLDALAELRT